jgi:hypothetical protein
MTPDELDGWLERARTEGASMVAPDGFTDRVMRQVRRREPPLPVWFDVLSSAVASGALVVAGIAIWMSVSEGPLDASSLPIAVTGVALTMGGLAWTWFDEPRGVESRLRLSDLRPY